MKMNYLLDNKTIFKNRDRKRKSYSPFLVLIVILFLLVVGGLIFGPLSSFVLRGFGETFLVNTRVGQSANVTFSFFQTKRSLVHENLTLKEALRDTRQELFNTQMNLEYLSDLNRSLPVESDVDFVGAVRVTNTPGFLPYDVMFLSFREPHSTVDLVSAGQQLRVRSNISLGEIVDIAGHSAKARLYSSPGVARRVLVGSENIPAVAYGRGGGNFVITLPRVLEIPELSLVRLQSQPDQIIGLVSQVEKNPENPSQIIYVRVPVNIYTLKWVNLYEY